MSELEVRCLETAAPAPCGQALLNVAESPDGKALVMCGECMAAFQSANRGTRMSVRLRNSSDWEKPAPAPAPEPEPVVEEPAVEQPAVEQPVAQAPAAEVISQQPLPVQD